MGEIGIGGEESAGASFLKKMVPLWTTNKDGMIMALLAMEMYAVMGTQLLRELYNNNVWGRLWGSDLVVLMRLVQKVANLS